MSSNFLNRLRRSAFWFLDALKGREVKKDLDEIRTTLNLNSFEELQKRNQIHLKALLDKAIQNSSYYSNLKGYTSLEDFPVVDKNIIKDNFEDMLIPSSNKDKLYHIYTSGSTGTPFKVSQNRRKKNRNTADTLFFAEKAGYQLGDKLLYLRLWSKKLRKAKVSAILQNVVQLDVGELQEDHIHTLLLELQKDKTQKGWIGYPSGLEKICDYLDSINSRPLDCKIRSIIGISENLSDHVRSKMWYYFGAPMVSRYSNTENGILAQQDIDSDYFMINWASYFIEILDFKKDVPVKNGELGRIVVTDLFNHVTPLIRYDTGDIGSMDMKTNHPFPVLCSVEGRQSDVLSDTKGNMISPFKFMSIVPEYPELKQIQFIQTNKNKYLIKINVSGTFEREPELIKLFKSYIGENSTVNVEYVDEIPSLISKKRKITRNLIVEKEKMVKKTLSTVH